jgi:hypothetical protein
MENVCIYYGHSEYYAAIWYILCPFDICSLESFGIFACFGTQYKEKSVNPDKIKCFLPIGFR